MSLFGPIEEEDIAKSGLSNDEVAVMLPDNKFDKGMAMLSSDKPDEVVVMDCCPAVCYKIFPWCVGDPDSPLWQEWYKHRLQISKSDQPKPFTLLELFIFQAD